MILAANILLEAMALYATWPQRLWTLRVFLMYLLAFDLVNIPVRMFATHDQYWYFYWIARTVVSIALQMALATQLLLRSKWRNRIVKELWYWTVVSVYAMATVIVWHEHPRYTVRMVSLTMIGNVLCGLLLFVAIAFRTSYRIVTVGCVLWVTASILCGTDIRFAGFYPLASLAPLLAWSSYYFVGRKFYAAERRQVRGTTRESNRSGDQVRAVHRTV